MQSLTPTPWSGTAGRELLRREPGRGVRAGRIEGDVAEVEQAGVADDDVQADRHHDEHDHVDAGCDVGADAEDRDREQVRVVERVHDRPETCRDRQEAATGTSPGPEGNCERAAGATRACCRTSEQRERPDDRRHRLEAVRPPAACASRRSATDQDAVAEEWSTKQRRGPAKRPADRDRDTSAASGWIEPQRAQLVPRADPRAPPSGESRPSRYPPSGVRSPSRPSGRKTRIRIRIAKTIDCVQSEPGACQLRPSLKA